MRKMRNQNLTMGLLALCAVLWCAPAACALSQGDPIPAVSFTSISGNVVELSAMKGKVVYLDIWASWCNACAGALSWINGLQKQFGADKFQVVAVNVDESRSDAERLLKGINLGMLVGFDPEGNVPSEMGVQAMPTSFLISPDGRILSIHEGLKDSDRAEIEKLIQSEIERAGRS